MNPDAVVAGVNSLFDVSTMTGKPTGTGSGLVAQRWSETHPVHAWSVEPPATPAVARFVTVTLRVPDAPFATVSSTSICVGVCWTLLIVTPAPRSTETFGPKPFPVMRSVFGPHARVGVWTMPRNEPWTRFDRIDLGHDRAA